jgi:hypothetical protein
MKTTYHVCFYVETESTTEQEILSTFDNLKDAKKIFNLEVKNAYRGKKSDRKDVSEKIVLIELENENYTEDICSQIIYSEGMIDRKNWKGNYAVNYYYYAKFNGKELMYEMYFQGKKEMWGKKHKVPQSQLSEWYY